MMEQVNLKNILTVAQAEKRLTRRLKRYWIFVLLAFAAGTFLFGYYNVLHAFFSSFSATLGNINPRYLFSIPSIAFQLIFTIGIVFIAFDVRARDVRERIVEVLDCRPVSNFELVAGRFFALFQLAWFPVLFLCLWLQFLGWTLPRLGLPIGIMIQPLLVLNFITLVSIPSFAFSIALVFLITLLVKNRVLAVVLSFAAIGGLIAGLVYLPIALYPLVDNFGLTVASPFPSDIISRLSTPAGWLQRTGLLIISGALVGFATVIHPRLDDSNRGRVMALWIMGFGGTVPIGNLIAGPIIDATSITVVVLFGAVIALGLAAYADLEDRPVSPPGGRPAVRGRPPGSP